MGNQVSHAPPSHQTQWDNAIPADIKGLKTDLRIINLIHGFHTKGCIFYSTKATRYIAIRLFVQYNKKKIQTKLIDFTLMLILFQEFIMC